MAKDFVKILLIFVYVTEVISLSSFEWRHTPEGRNLSVGNEVWYFTYFAFLNA